MKKSELKRLHDLGLSLHWLHPNTKAPVDYKWTSIPRHEFASLISKYPKGANVGTRLGSVSKFSDGTYLAVLDGDVKSSDPRHQKEMEAALLKFYPDAEKAPTVMSGRGFGSRHVYIRTKAPVSPTRVTQSSELVEAYIPSIKPSKRDLEKLGPEKVKQGLRVRPAWELSLMGEGQQVVLPPSLHPDSKKPYVWLRPLLVIPPLFEVNFGVGVAPNGGAKDLKVGDEFHPVEDFDLDLVGLDPRTVELIRTGENCTDRSAALFLASMAMVKAGMTDEEILTVLTDKGNFLGEAAYDHTQSGSRVRAAKWVEKFTLAKVRREYSAESDFSEAYVQGPLLSKAEAEKQLIELTEVSDWQLKIERAQSTGKPKNTLENAILILDNDVGDKIFLHNEFSGTDTFGLSPPWGGENGKEITDADITKMKVYLARKFRIEFSNDRLNEAVSFIARRNSFHPVRDYLKTLEWDGKPRIGKWLKTYLGAEAAPAYLEAVSRKILCAMVARVWNPGTKFDQVLILQGDQGMGKSTVIRNLVSEAWFSDQTINMADKDSVLNLKGVWALELGELSGMRQADVELLKEFISRATDRIRVPYGRRTEAFPRQCVFIGSTNKDEYLKDTTGNRRFWPVKVTECDFEAIKRDRDQLFAEAVLTLDMGEPLYLEDDNAHEEALEEQESRMVHDNLNDVAYEFFAKLRKIPENERMFPIEKFTLADTFQDFGPFAHLKDTKGDQMRAAEALKYSGFEKVQLRVNGRVNKVWVVKDPLKNKRKRKNDFKVYPPVSTSIQVDTPCN